MTIIFVPLLFGSVIAEQSGNPLYAKLGVDTAASDTQPGGNMEGKEARFGIVNSAIWASATTAASNGSVNSMHDSFTPLGGLVPMFLIKLGEVIYGGVGSGLYGMLIFAIIAVFVAGLMVGRTPEYLGKKIEAYEIKMSSLIILIPGALVLIGTAVALMSPAGQATIYNPGTHGYSEVLYAFASAGNNGVGLLRQKHGKQKPRAFMRLRGFACTDTKRFQRFSTLIVGTPSGIRTRDLHLERVLSWAARRWGPYGYYSRRMRNLATRLNFIHC